MAAIWIKSVSFRALDLDWRILGEYYPGDRGRTSGPPENCYPPEPPAFTDLTIFLEKDGLAIDVTELAHTVTLDDGPGLGRLLAYYLASEALVAIAEEGEA